MARFLCDNETMSDREPPAPPLPPPLIERFNLLNDVLFKKLFGEKGDEPQLLAFLKPILARTGRELESIEILEDTAQRPETLAGKAGILDSRGRLSNGNYCNVEVQRQNQWNIERRSLFYWAKEYSSSIVSGQNYRQLPDVIAVNLLDFNYFPLSNFHTSYHLWEDTDKTHKLTDAIEMHFIEMPKFRKLPEKDIRSNELHRWLSFLDVETPLTLIKEIIQMDTVIAQTEESLKRFVQNDAVRHAYLRQEMAALDELSRNEGAWTDGRKAGMEAGMEKGMEKGMEAAAQNALREGLSVDSIQRITGLPAEAIKKLSLPR
ncbi:hypothetical protein FACS1894147_12630 [Spirochaetia bacterium]|nr:hypothetical protein FACS1894147_12630 [Spirochaetia bacterium]